MESPNSYNSQYNSQNTQNTHIQPSAFQRVPLPDNLSQPPSLTSAGSTFQSNLELWAAPQMNITTLPLFDQGNKRKFEEEDPAMGQPSFEEYSARHGRLQFDEDF